MTQCYNCSCWDHLDGTTSSEKKANYSWIWTPHIQESRYAFKCYICLHNQNAKQMNEREWHWMQLRGKSKDNTTNTMEKNMEYGWSRNARPQTVKAGWTTWYSNSQDINIKHAVFHVQMQCSMKPECISIRSICEVGWINVRRLIKTFRQGSSTKSFRLHPWVPTKHCCFSMQVSQFRMVFPGFTYLAKETNCLPSPAVYKASPTCPCSVKIGSSGICKNLAIVWLFQCV